MTRPAVLIIAHRRPHYLKSVLESVMSQFPSSLYISIDGARETTLGDVELVKECQELATEFQIKSEIQIYTRFNSNNLGSAANVIQSIDWFFDNEESGVVLEEDCVPHPTFLDYMEQNLRCFEMEQRVWLVSGYRPEIDNLTGEPCLVHLPMNWGWGTWAKKWELIRSALLESAFLQPIYLLPLASVEDVFWNIGARRSLKGFVDAWDTPLAFAMWKYDKLTVIPPMNLISNIGTDNLSLNTSKSSRFLETETYAWGPSIKNSDTSSFNHSEIQENDRLLATEMIGINWKHRFLPLIKYSFQMIFHRNRGRGNLKDRLEVIGKK
jgi:hypothetical protein